MRRSKGRGKTLKITSRALERRHGGKCKNMVSRLERKACLRDSLFLEDQRKSKEKISVLRGGGPVFYPRKGFGRVQEPRSNCVVCLKQF